MNFEYMKNYMDRLTLWRIPGNSIRVCLGGKEVFTYNSGYSDLENKIPMGKDMFLNIYSCSKVATVSAALKLYEEGMFLLDDPLYDFIPEFREMYIKKENGELVKAKNHITLRNLFTMTSGLTYNMETDAFKKAREITGGKMDTLAVAKCIAEDPILFEPGEGWQYSLSHDILAAVVEVVSGMKFRDYMNKNIFGPLGMEKTFYHANNEIYCNMAEQYRFEVSTETDLVKLQSEGSKDKGGSVVNVGKSNRFIFGDEYDSGGAGIITTVNDYSKFVTALSMKGKGEDGERILSEGTIELLRTNQLNDEVKKGYAWPQLKGYGYGLGVRTLMDKALSGSTGNLKEFGWGGAAGATVLIDTDIGLSVFYAHHMLNPQEEYYQPRLRNVAYTCING